MGSGLSQEIPITRTNDVEKNAQSHHGKVSDMPPTSRVLDWQKAARLHNQILSMGCAGEVEMLELVTWWDCYFGDYEIDLSRNIDTKSHSMEMQEVNRDPATAAELERRLPAELVNFLKHANHVYPKTRNPHSRDNDLEPRFFFYVERLASPSDLLRSLNAGDGSPVSYEITSGPGPRQVTVSNSYWPWKSADRYLELYQSYDSGPFIMAIPEMKVVIREPSLFDYELIPEAQDEKKEIETWITLEIMLEYFLEMIVQGRISSGSPGEIFPNSNEYTPSPVGPWYIPVDGRGILNATLSAWDDLISTITARLPPSTIISPPMHYTDEAIRRCNSPDLFLSSFLREIRIPTMFRYVAPGLRVALLAEIIDQPFKHLTTDDFPTWGNSMAEHHKTYYKFLFLHADATIIHSTCGSQTKFKDTISSFNHMNWHCASSYDCGLYLQPNGNMERPDEFRLLLPFAMEPDKYVRYGSGQKLEDRERWDGLYQAGMGLNVLPKWWTTRLEMLFRQWAWMVEKGYWEVGKEGIIGGIDKLKEADSAEKWELYTVKKTW